MHGWGSDLPTDALWKPAGIRVQDIAAFVEASLARRDFVAGDSDLCFGVESPSAQFVFCHECDIHLKAEDREFMGAFRKFLEGLGIPVIHVST